MRLIFDNQPRLFREKGTLLSRIAVAWMNNRQKAEYYYKKKWDCKKKRFSYRDSTKWCMFSAFMDSSNRICLWDWDSPTFGWFQLSVSHLQGSLKIATPFNACFRYVSLKDFFPVRCNGREKVFATKCYFETINNFLRVTGKKALTFGS